MKKIVLIVSFLFLLTAYSVSAQGGAFGLNNSDANSKGANDLFQNFSKKPAEEPTKSFFDQFRQDPTPENPEPTSIPLPTATPEPTAIPDPFADVPTQQGVVWRTYPCGQDLNFTIVYQPIMTTVQSNLKASGKFILFRVQIQNLKDREISGLKFESFTLSKAVNGAETVYPLSPFFSNVTSMLWDLGLMRNSIPSKGTLDTYLVFDVEGAVNDPWVLNFLPEERFSGERFTPIRITLPAVSAQ